MSAICRHPCGTGGREGRGNSPNPESPESAATEHGTRGPEGIYLFHTQAGSKISGRLQAANLAGAGSQGKGNPMEVHLGQSGVRLPKENHTTSPSLRK